MSCRETKLTKEQVVNGRKNGDWIMQPLLNQTLEETLQRLDNLRAAKLLKNDKYFLFDESVPIKTRVSEEAKRKSGLREQSVNPDNDIKREGGTFVHEIANDIMNYLIEGKKPGKLNEMRSKALNGKYKMKNAHFEQLVKLVEETYDNIQEQQKRIDPKGKATILTEQFIVDFLEDKGGTVDILAVFSDNTASLYDYKTSSKRNAIGLTSSGKDVINNIFPYYDIQAYDLSMTEYKRILLERIGVKAIRQNRLLPIATQYKWKPSDEQQEGAQLLPEFETLIAHIDGNEFMKPIPVGGEQSRWEGINKLLENQFKLLKTLGNKLKYKDTTVDQKQQIKDKITRVENSIKRTLVDEDILDLIQSMRTLAVEAKTRLNEPKTKDEKDNPSYLSDTELEDLRNEMFVYSDIVANTHTYFKEMKEGFPEKYDKLLKELSEISLFYDTVFNEVKLEMEKRVEDGISSRFKDASGHLLPFKELGIADMTFLRMSEINNPIFKTAWKIIEDAQYETKKKFEKLDDTVYPKTEAVFKWAHENGISRMDAWKILINEKTGNLYSKLNPKFALKRTEALEKGDASSIKFLKDNYEFKNKEKWQAEYKNRLEAQKAILKAQFNNLEPIRSGDKIKVNSATLKERYTKALEKWIASNDLIHSDSAWLNQRVNRKYLKLKESALEANLSDEYKKIKSIKPLYEFYEMWQDYMEEFADIFGISDYSVLPPNFIPNIRKEFIEHLNADSFHPGAAMSEILDSFNVREEDVYIGHTNEDGIARQIPILFLNKFFDKNGKVDLNRKSYDLSASLMQFGKMAYNYEHMLKIEPKIIGLRTLMGEPSPEQGGIQATDNLVRRIKGKVQPYLTKEGRMTKTYELFEDLTDAYLYGVRFKEGSLIAGYDTTHILSMLKNFNSQLKLSFAILPASGAYVAGKTGAYITGKKGIMYTSEQFSKTARIKLTNKKLYDAIGEYFDAENDDYLQRDIQKHKASVKNRVFNSRTGFAPLRNADKDNMRDILVSMTQNYGIDDKGQIVRLTRRGIDKSKYTPIIELFKEVDGKYVIDESKLPKEAFKSFRAAVKSTGGSVFGNMNPDDIGRMETNLLVNQAMSFRSWMPAVVRERIGKARWNEETQAMDIGRFVAYWGEYANNLTPEQLEDGKVFYMYTKHILLPNLTKLVLDLTTFGLVPSIVNNRVNQARAKKAFMKWQVENPGLRDTVTFEDFLEAKEGQIKAMMVELRIILGLMALVMFFAGAGDDGKPRYYANWATRNIHKIFTKAGSELTFMWNPTEFIRLMANPFPVTGLLTQVKNTVKNGVDESRDYIFGENSAQDKTPPGYYMFQWMYGAPQLMRFLEVYKQMEKNPYQIYQF